MSQYTRGRSREYRTMALLEAAGYDAYRMAGSHGAFDVIGVGDTGIVLVQVKLGEVPGPSERALIRLAKCPSNGSKLVHRYRVGKHLPDVFEVGDLKE